MEPLGRVVTVLLAIVTTATAVGTPGGCEADVPTKKILCHINTSIHPATNPCMCTHIVVHDTGLLNQVEKFKLKNKRLKILTKESNADVNLKRGLDGLYLKLDKPPIKGKLNDAIKALAISLDNAQSAKRARAKYQGLSAGESDGDGLEIFMELPPEPQKLTKHYDIKALTKYINYFVVPTENLTDATEQGLAYHPSRLMGIDDILNADSLVDLLSGLGVEHEKLIMALPAYVLQFKLKNAKKNMPRDPVVGYPSKLSQAQFCKIMEEGGWTLEREEDMTAPYAYKGTDWMAFDDSTSTSIKAKYILLRDLAGLSVVASEHDDWTHSCSARPLLDTIHYTFTNLARKSRAAQLLSLQDQIHNSFLPFGAEVHLSPYRIVRVVDRAGAVHIVRKEAKTEFQCSRQGYFTHPSGCNRFYRCVKFNQYSSDFTVFEYDCPAGLAFDEKYEVCVWPGSLRDASPCKGSSEIAPVPRNRFSCNAEGYFADPENCRWFFACLDHQRDGLTPPTAYEFRCPFGLVFDNSRLVCDWPWKVPGCGSGHVGVISSSSLYPGDILEGRLRPAYADVSDVHVSGGRISGVSGGLVLGTTLLSGIAEQNAGTYATGNLRGPSYSLGLDSINVATGDRSGQYVEDNSGAYIHDPTGDTGGEYKHEGEYAARFIGDGVDEKLHTQNIIGNVYDSNNLASVRTAGSGAYIHDNRGDAGGVYAHDGYVKTVSGLSSGGLAQGTILAGGIPADRSGAYVHDVRGDTGGAYVHVGGAGTGTGQGRLYVPSGGVVRTGSVLTGRNGAYVHDTRGDSGGSYVYSGGVNVVPGISSGQKIYTSFSSPGTVLSQGGLVGTRGHIAGISAIPQAAYLGTSGGYVHDLGTVTGLGTYTLGPQGIAVGSKTSSLLGPKLKTTADINLINTGAYVHDSSGDYGQPYIHDSSGDYGSTYYGGKYVVGSGAQVKTSLYGGPGFGVSYGDGAYVHDSRGYYGGGYYQPGFRTYVPANTYGIKVNQANIYQPSAPVVHTYDATRLSAVQPAVRVSPITVSNVPSVPLKSVQYIHPAVRPVVSVSTPSPQLIGYHYAGGVSPSGAISSLPVQSSVGKIHPVILSTPATPVVKSQTAIPLTVSGTPATVVSNIHLVKPVQPVVTYGHYPGSYSHQQPLIRTQTVRPITVSSTPVVPFNPVQYVHSGFVGTPATPVISSYRQSIVQPIGVNLPAAPAVSYQQPYIKTQTVRPVTISSTPLGPLKQDIEVGHISTPSPPVVHYSYNQQPIIKTQSVLPVSASNVPAGPALTFAQPFIRTQTVRPITVSSTPVVPLSPVQYAQKQFVSTPAPPVINYSYKQHVPVSPVFQVGQPVVQTQTVRPVAVPASPVLPVSGVNYGQKTVVSTPAFVRPAAFGAPEVPELSFVQQPLIRTQTVRPITVSSTPVVPYSPIQYVQKQFVSTPAPAVVRPVAVGVPGASFVQQPFIRTQTIRPITVSSTPVIPFSPVQYAQNQLISTSAPPIVSYAYKQHVPISPVVSVGQPVIETQTVRPVAVPASPVVPVSGVNYDQRTLISTPAPAVVRPVAVGAPGASFVQQPFIRTQTVRPITVSSTPVVPFSPVQYAQNQFVSTPAPPIVSYSYKQNVPISPVVSVGQPVIETQTVRPVAVPASPVVPVSGVNYGQRTVISTPAPGVLRPVAIGVPGPSFVQQPFIRTQTVRPITVSSTPVVPFSPVQYAQKQFVSTPAPPIVSYSYKQHVPVSPVVSVGQPLIETQTVRPVAVPASPVVPVSGVNYGQRTVISTSAPTVVRPVAVGVPGASFAQQPFIRTQTVRPITVSSTPVVPFSPVQYAQKQFVSTPAPPIVSYSYKQHVPVSPVVSVGQPLIETQTLRPVTVPASPVVPVSGGYYGQRTVISTPAPGVLRPVAVGVPGPSFVQQPFIRTQTVRPITVSSTPVVPFSPVQYAQKQFVSTPAPPIVSYSYKQHVPVSPVVSVGQPLIETQTVRPVAVPASPVVPVSGVNYGQRTVISTSAPTVVRPVAVGVPGASFVQQPFIRTQTVRPITVSSTPVVPFSPVQYTQKQFVSTPAPPIVSYSYKQHVPVSPVVSVGQPLIETQTLRPVTVPASPVVPVSGGYYGQRTVISTSAPTVVRPVAVGVPGASFVQQPFFRTQTVRPITVSSTPVVPFSPVQYAQKQFVSTPAPPIVSYSYKQHAPVSPIVSVGQPLIETQTVRPVTVSASSIVPVSGVNYGQRTVISTPAPAVVRPVAVGVPGAPFVQQPFIRTQTVRPITVSTTPVVPFSPVQYAQKQFVSTSAPSIVSYSPNQPVPVAPVVSYAQPVIKTQTVRPLSFSSTPLVPLNAVNYAQETIISPAQQQSQVYCASCSVTQTASPITVTSTPIVPYNSVQYVKGSVSPSALPVASYSYKQQVPLAPGQPLIKSQTVRPITVSSTTAAPIVSYQQPVIKTQTVSPVVVSSSPTIPLSPVQYVPNAYVSTPSPPVVSYTYQKPVFKTHPIQPVVFSSPAPFIESQKIGIKAQTVAPVAVTSQVPSSPVQYVTSKVPIISQQPIGYSYPQPAIKFETPLKAITTGPAIQPVVSYSYQQPDIKTTLVTSTPAVPLNPVPYVRPVQPKPIFPYSFEKIYPQQPVAVSSPALVSYQQPIIKTPTTPVRPVVVTTPAPTVLSYKQPVINAQTVSPITVTSTPVVPLSPVQYVRPAEPKLSYTYSTPQPFTVSTPAPPVVSYQQPVIKTVPTAISISTPSIPLESVSYQQPITVTSTPVVPLSPVQYGKPAVSFSYVKPRPDIVNTVRLPIASYPQTFIKSQTIKPIVPVVTPAPTTVTYTQPGPSINIVSQTPSVVSYQPIVQKTVSPITVTSTPAVPLKEVQYIKPAEPNTVLNYNYIKEQQPAVTFTSQVPVIKEKTIVTSQPAIAIQPVVSGKPSVGTYYEEYFETNQYQKPVGAVQGAGFVKTPVSSVLLPEVSTVRPAINLPLSVDTVQTVPVGVAEEDLNVNLDIQKVGLPLVTTSTPQQVVEVTTAAPILKKVRVQGGGSRGGYYVRKPVKVQPVVTTTANYPAFYTSTVKPVYSSTIDLTSPTFYSTTVTPSTTTVEDYALDVEGDDDTSLLEQVSGGFGEIINAGGLGIIREGVSSTTVSSLKDGEAVVGVIKKEREPLTGRKKTKVVVVSRLSDFNPLLVGKLGAVCSCKTDTKTLDLSGTQRELFRPEPSREYLPTSSAPLSQELTSFDYNDVNPSIVEIKPVQKTQSVYTTTTAVPLSEGTVDYVTTSRPSRRIDSQIDCQRPGLFRHPHLCNKFYSCDWDQKKKRFSVNIFNCPVHLAFDSKLGACNWPSKGPACSDNNLLV